MILFLVIFAETGFVLTPFLPGDSLLFVAGTLSSVGDLNIFFLFFLLSLAAIIGDTVNYYLGRSFGTKIFSKLISKERLEGTRLFFHKHGKKTIILARFIPIIRTFAPFVAGIGRMDYLIFLIYNLIGGILWVFFFLFAGFYFGNIPIIKENLSLVILLIIIISMLPLIIQYFKNFKKKKV
jgi:membrane-associated protein